MIENTYNVKRYDADEGKVFDWADLESHKSADGTQEHLYAKTLFMGDNDSIENYVEVVKPVEE